MPLNQPPSPVSPMPALADDARATTPWRRLRPVLAGLTGAAALGGLGAAGKADPLYAGMAAAVVSLIGVALALGLKPLRRVTSAGAAVDAPATGRDEAKTYLSALELAPNPVLLVSGEDIDDIAGRRVLFANAEARDFLRISQEGALLVSAIRHPGVLEAIDESLFGRTARTLSYESGGPQERYWRVWTKPLPPSGRHARMALVILRDETDVRLNERMRADFLANASHELRTPLASLTGFIETLRGHARDDPGARERFLEIMSRQADRMARLIDDLLSLSRIELNEHIRPSGRFDLSLAAADVIDALGPQIATRGVKVELHAPTPGEATLAGDRDQVVQVIQNLLDNAVKYAPPDSVVQVEAIPDLSLETAAAVRANDPRVGAPNGGRMSLLTPVRATAAQRYVLLRVEDSGRGLAREHLPRLTERFYRVEGQNSGARTGTGLGLAIVKHIVNRHRGGFFVESAPGRGAAFGVYLPMADEARPAAPRGPPSEPPDAPTAPPRKISALETKLS